MTTYELPPEPPVGTRLVDRGGVVWRLRPDGRWEADSGDSLSTTWPDLVSTDGPLTEVPAPALPTEPGSIIRATGADAGEPFEDAVLIRDYDGYWQGVTATLYPIYHPGDRIDSFTVLATHDPATQVVVPRKEWEALKSEVRSVVASAGAGIDPAPYIARKARALVRAAEEAER